MSDYRIAFVTDVCVAEGYVIANDKVSAEPVLLMGARAGIRRGDRVYYHHLMTREGIMVADTDWMAESRRSTSQESIEELMMPSMYLSARGEMTVLPISRPAVADPEDEHVQHGAAENRCYTVGVTAAVGQPYSNRRATKRVQTPAMWQDYFASQAS